MATKQPVLVAEVAVPTMEAPVTAQLHKKLPVKPTKGKKTIRSLHPPYFEMIKDAISTLKEKTGSSQYAIAKFVEQKQRNLPEKFKKILLIQLKRLVAEGKLVKIKASYKLPAAKPPAKKKPAAKPKPAAKKERAKKKPAVAENKPIEKPKEAAPKAVVKRAVKAKAKPVTKPEPKVARTSRRTTPGKKVAPAPTPIKVSAAAANSAAKSVKPKTPKPKKSDATRNKKK